MSQPLPEAFFTANQWIALMFACAALVVASWAGVGAVQRALHRRGVYDMPNARSSHAVPTPRGAGLALVPILVLSWLLAAAGAALVWQDVPPPGFVAVLIGTVGLAAVSWIDDLRGLPVISRLGAHVVAVTMGVAALGDAGPVFQGLLPPALDRFAAGLMWLWFINLFNFMDGIDGLAGAETMAIGLGLALIGALIGRPWISLALPALAAAAAAGFLVWNWAPARIFLGDVGSVPLGYLLGWLLLGAATDGAWAAAVLLPLYYLSDATWTLLRRAMRGARVWQAHREHFYQRAVRSSRDHAAVVHLVSAGNAALVACAAVATVVAPLRPAAVIVGFGIVIAVLSVLARRARRVTAGDPRGRARR